MQAVQIPNGCHPSGWHNEAVLQACQYQKDYRNKMLQPWQVHGSCHAGSCSRNPVGLGQPRLVRIY